MPSSETTSSQRFKRILTITRKIIVRTVLGIIVLLLVIIGLIQLPSVQNYLKGKVVSAMAEKLHTKVELGYIRINFGGNLVLEDLFIADRQQDTVVYAEKLKVAVNPFGLLKKRVLVSNILLSGTNFNYLVLDEEGRTNIDFILNSFAGEKKMETPQKESSWDIQLKKLQVNRSRFAYENFSDSMRFNLSLGKLVLVLNSNNLDSLKFDIDRILIQNTKASLTTYALTKHITGTDEAKDVKDVKDSANLIVSVGKIDVLSFAFEQADSLIGVAGSYSIGELHLKPKKIDISKQIIDIASIQLVNGKVNYKAAEAVEKPESEETQTPKNEASWKINLDQGDLAFTNVRLTNMVAKSEGLEYLSDISLSNLASNVAAEFNSAKLWNVDLKSLRFRDDRTERLVSMNAKANSKGDRMQLNPFHIQLGSSHITGTMEGNFAGGPKGSIPNFDATINSSQVIIADFKPYLPQKMDSVLFRIPSQLALTAELKTQNQVLNGKGLLKSNKGNIQFVAQMGQSPVSPYRFKVDLMNVDAGFFAQNKQLGMLSATINASGSGFKPDSMKTEMNLKIAEVTFDSIEYRDLSLAATLNRGLIDAKLTSDNPFAKLVLKAYGRMGDRSTFRVNTHIQNLDLYAMNLIEDTVAISGVIDANYNAVGKGRFRASTDTLMLNVRTPDDEINTNSYLSYFVLGDTVEARVKSEFGDITYDGNVPLQEVAAIMKNYFEQFFSEEKADSARQSDRFFRVAVNIRDLSLLSHFTALKIDIPEEANIRAELKDNNLISNVDIEKIILKEMEVDNLKIDASGRDSAFHVNFQTAAIHNNVHTIKDLSLKSNLRAGDLKTRLEFSNASSEKWFNIGAEMEPRNPELNLVIQEPLLLNHLVWEVDELNRTFIQNKNVVFSNVKLMSGNKLISLLSDAKKPEKLAVVFENLDLKLLSEVMNGDTNFLSASFDGSLMATNLFAKPVPSFDAKLDIANIVVEKRALGDLNIAASNLQNNDVALVDVKFGRDSMRLNLNGSYGLRKDLPMNLTLATQNLSLAAIQPLIKNVISNASGAVNASLNVRGSFADPEVQGEIGFDKASAFVEQTQSQYSIDKQKILFRGDGIDFNKFTIKDAEGHNMEINGKIILANLKNYQYDLNIVSNEFLAYQGPPDNLPGQDNRVILTSDINITGKNNVPDVNADIRIDEGSKFFYKITKKASNLTEEGIIEFVGDTTKEETVPEPSLAENLNLTTYILLEENTKVTIITDPVRNLGLNMTAGGTFSMNQRPFQSPRLTGRLDISGGDYTISLSGIKRKFQIADSSFIEWYGKISEPEMSLRAYYQVRTSPAELLGPESTEENSTLPFMVNMYISGTLEDPKFNFRLSLPREYENANNGIVAAKLQEINSNESDLNQKAMALLLFGSFGFNDFTNVFSSNNGGANVIISNALNQFASQKLKFVDLHFDLQSYDNYGTETNDNLRTEMEIAASKKFVDERLNVQLGTTIVLQADEQEQQELEFYERISPEFNIEYMLNKPRTLSVRTFRRSEYRGLVEGKVISTGAGFLFQKDFDKFSDLFGKKPEDAEPVAEIQNDADEKK